jgi:signal transduction histidine kinase
MIPDPDPRSSPAVPEGDEDLLAPGLLHDLRQPLMGIAAAVELLERELGGRLLDGAGTWRMLRGQVARAVEMVRGYEELVRPGDLAPSPFDVGPVVARAVELLAHRVRPLAGRFAFDPGAERPGFGAAGAVLHAAANLLANALDAVDSAAGRGRVAVRVLAAGSSVEVRVSDEGSGVPAELRSRIFEPRFTTKPEGKGTGLGLHLAGRLMARFGGRVYLVDDRDPARLPWAVSEFCIALPAPPAGRTG